MSYYLFRFVLVSIDYAAGLVWYTLSAVVYVCLCACFLDAMLTLCPIVHKL